jgi:hypothetical protein
MREPTRTYELIELLCRHRVEFIVVGMTSAVLQGAPALTFDLDIVYARDDDNVTRLLQVLGEIGALFRNDPRKLAPNRSHVASPGHKLLETKLGHFDVLGSLDEGVGYEQLLPDTTVLDIQGLSVRVLTLERLIAEKERAGREKDKAVLPLLRATSRRSRERP